MAQSEPDAKPAVAAAVVVNGRDPYTMYDVLAVSATQAHLRGPLLLEIGEAFTLRLSRGGTTIEVPTKVAQVLRHGEHDEPELVVTFSPAYADRLRVLVG